MKYFFDIRIHQGLLPTNFMLVQNMLYTKSAFFVNQMLWQRAASLWCSSCKMSSTFDVGSGSWFLYGLSNKRSPSFHVFVISASVYYIATLGLEMHFCYYSLTCQRLRDDAWGNFYSKICFPKFVSVRNVMVWNKWLRYDICRKRCSIYNNVWDIFK